MRQCEYCSERANKKYSYKKAVYCSIDCAEMDGLLWCDSHNKLISDGTVCEGCFENFPNDELTLLDDGTTWCHDCLDN